MDPRLFTAVVVVVGVPAVLVGYIYAVESLLRFAPEQLPGRIRPWFWLAPALALLFVFLIYADDQHDRPELPEQAAGTEFVGLDNYIWFFSTGERARSRFATALLWVVFLTLLHGRARPAHRGARGPRPLRVGRQVRRSSCRWRSAWSRPASSGGSCTPTQPPGPPQTGTVNGVLAACRNRAGRLAHDRHAGPQHDPPDRRHGLDVDRVRDGHPVGGAQGHQHGAARGGARRRRDRVAGVPRDHPSRCSCRRSRSSSTTIIITALKAFDIVYMMTNGDFDTDDIALLHVQGDEHPADFGRASAVAVVLLLAIIPIMAVNISRFRAQEAIR